MNPFGPSEKRAAVVVPTNNIPDQHTGGAGRASLDKQCDRQGSTTPVWNPIPWKILSGLPGHNASTMSSVFKDQANYRA